MELFLSCSTEFSQSDVFFLLPEVRLLAVLHIGNTVLKAAGLLSSAEKILLLSGFAFRLCFPLSRADH